MRVRCLTMALVICAAMLAVPAGPARAATPAARAMIPTLREWTAASGAFGYGPATRIVVDPALQPTGATLATDLAALTGVTNPLVVGSTVQSGDIRLALGAADAQLGTEGYQLTVGSVVT